MEVTLQITTRNIPHSEALESHICEKAEKLERFYPHIMSCRIVMELPHKHHHQGRRFDVHIHMTVPGGDLAVNRSANEDVYVAVRDAFDAAKRQLEITLANNAAPPKRTPRYCMAKSRNYSRRKVMDSSRLSTEKNCIFTAIIWPVTISID